ncbi:MAG: transcriptional regulator [Bacilli bacterium]|nr:transcriptional regulator [Bacilli bacterium]
MKKTVHQLVGAKVREIRHTKGLSQEKLAELADTHYSYIGGLERGDRNITIGTLEKVAIALEIDFFELFDLGIVVLKGNSKIMNDIIELLLNKNEHELSKIFNILNEMYK